MLAGNNLGSIKPVVKEVQKEEARQPVANDPAVPAGLVDSPAAHHALPLSSANEPELIATDFAGGLAADRMSEHACAGLLWTPPVELRDDDIAVSAELAAGTEFCLDPRLKNEFFSGRPAGASKTSKMNMWRRRCGIVWRARLSNRKRALAQTVCD